MKYCFSLIVLLLFTRTSYAQIDSTASEKSDTVLIQPKPKLIKGIASFYSRSLQGTKTATGERFDQNKLTGASNSVKLNTWVKVTNLRNGDTVIVRINDRMHPRMKKKGRVIDLSRAAARKLGFLEDGLTRVSLEIINKPEDDQ
jgi:rare lipoprotein A (peptidoglycan hydrolase)